MFFFCFFPGGCGAADVQVGGGFNHGGVAEFLSCFFFDMRHENGVVLLGTTIISDDILSRSSTPDMIWVISLERNVQWCANVITFFRRI